MFGKNKHTSKHLHSIYFFPGLNKNLIKGNCAGNHLLRTEVGRQGSDSNHKQIYVLHSHTRLKKIYYFCNIFKSKPALKLSKI